MPSFIVRTINSRFDTETETDQPQSEDALALGVQGALMIAADEINRGGTAAVVEVAVEDATGAMVHSVAVTASVAPLAIRSVSRLPLPTR